MDFIVISKFICVKTQNAEFDLSQTQRFLKVV
jgi:hypothetical protein